MYYPVSALVTLFANVIQNPQDPRGRSDLQLINTIVEFLTTVVHVEHADEAKMTSDDVQRMLMICGEFRRIAASVLDKAERDSSVRRKRKLNGEATSMRPNPAASRSQTNLALSNRAPPAPTNRNDGTNGVNPPVYLSPFYPMISSQRSLMSV